MKRKYSVEIHRNGSFNDAIVSMTTNHNEGLVEITFSTIAGFIHGKFAQYPTITPVTEIKTSYPNGTMDIVEGSKHTMTITEKHLEELNNGVDEAPTVFLNEGINDPNNKEALN